MIKRVRLTYRKTTLSLWLIKAPQAWPSRKHPLSWFILLFITSAWLAEWLEEKKDPDILNLFMNQSGQYIYALVDDKWTSRSLLWKVNEIKSRKSTDDSKVLTPNIVHPKPAPTTISRLYSELVPGTNVTLDSPICICRVARLTPRKITRLKSTSRKWPSCAPSPISTIIVTTTFGKLNNGNRRTAWNTWSQHGMLILTQCSTLARLSHSVTTTRSSQLLVLPIYTKQKDRILYEWRRRRR